MEIKDVKCLVRSGYSINGSDCPELAFIFCQLRHGLVQAAGARTMETEVCAMPGLLSWTGQPLTGPWFEKGFRDLGRCC